MSSAERLRPKAVPRWPVSLGVLVALGAALGSFTKVFTDPGWWFTTFGVIALMVGAIAGSRALLRRRFLPPLVGLAVLIGCLTFSFAADVAWVGLIPNGEVLARFGQLFVDGRTSINQQYVPAEPVAGIVFIITVGAGLLAIVLDAIAVMARRPALIGVPLLILLLVPGTLDRLHNDPFFFILTAVAYLFVLYQSGGEVRAGGAFGVAAGGIVVALLLPLVLPAVIAGKDESTAPGGGFAVSVDSFINLGDDLRRGRITKVLTYTTDAARPVYLRLSTLENFTGEVWKPTPPGGQFHFALDNIGPIPGLSAAIPTTVTTTSVAVLDMGGHWLPAPYAPATITGTKGVWSWDADSLVVSSTDASSRDQKYAVTATIAEPTQSQLRDSGAVSGSEFLPYLAVPEDLPAVVTQTAFDVAGDQPTNFDKAIALQNYFTGGLFTYSTEAPVAGGYDGTSAAVIAKFLEVKSGYCVHFSSAMAVMARTLGIPARIAIGFTPGELIGARGDKAAFYQVTTENLHAWPELYFNTIGWVRFEPTVGRGEAPDFDAGNTSSPVDPSAPPTSTPTVSSKPSTPTASTTPTIIANDGNTSNGASFWVPLITVLALAIVALVVLLLPLVPIIVRIFRRRLRYWRIWRHASATAAWAELNDTAVDLGWSAATTTPRQFAALVRLGFPQKAMDALDRLRMAVEATAYSRDRGTAIGADVRLVRRAMARASTRRERLLALFSPRSVAPFGRRKQ